MARKGKDDDLTFDPGDELFPLDQSSKGDKNKKPPKGVKGYLKNVVKSAFNLTVKVNKSLYPEVFSLVEESRFEDNDGNKFNIKNTIDKYKTKFKGIVTESKDIAKDIAKDAKESLRTGYFVKTEDEEMDMGDMFGDMGLDDDFDLSDSNFGNEDWGDDEFDTDGNEIPKKKGKLSTGDAIIKSSAAGARATLRASNKQIAATIGSTQSHIQHETALFAQQLQIDQERHIQKMKVLKNIAHNIATTVKQNNLSIKAQMEYSTKSLAFTQDLAAMIKEIRDAQWVLTKPEEKDTNLKESKFRKILGGSGANIGAWTKHFSDNFKNNAFGGIGSWIETFGDMFNSMGDMGMSKASLIKSMASSFLIDTIAKGSLKSSTQDRLDLFNIGVAGLPSAINNMFGKWAAGGTKGITDKIRKLSKSKKVPKWIRTKLDDWGIGDKADDLLKSFGSNAYLKEQIQYSSDRFKMDPNRVHPFDNKAHKALTEIIPGFLSKISAGVNHTEEIRFDYDQNRFVSVKSINQEIEEAQKSALTNTRGYDTLKGKFSIRNHQEGITKKGVNIDREKTDKAFDMIFRGFLEQGYHFDKHDLGELSKKNSDVRASISKYLAVCNLSEDEEDHVVKAFIRSVSDMKYSKSIEDKKDFRELFVDSSAYKSRLSQENLNVEETFAKNIDTYTYNEAVAGKQFSSSITQLEDKIRRAKERENFYRKKLESNPSDTKCIYQIKKFREERKELEKQLSLLNTKSHFKVDNTNSSNFSNMESTFNSSEGNDFEKYRMASLEDTSTHGIVQNIYNLLLSGIDVYIKKEGMKEHDQLVKNMQTKVGNKYGKEKTEEKRQLRLAKLTKIDAPSEFEDFIKDYEDFHGKFETESGEQYQMKDFTKTLYNQVKNDLYMNSNEYNAYNYKKYKHQERNDGDIFSNAWHNSKIPFVGKITRTFDKLQRLKAKIGNTILKPIYGEPWFDESDGKTIDAITKLPKQAQEYVQNKINQSKNELTLFKANPEKYLKNAKKEFEQKMKETGGKIKEGGSQIATHAKTSIDSFVKDNKAIKNISKTLFDTELNNLKPDKDSSSEFKKLPEAIASIKNPEFKRTLEKIPKDDLKNKVNYLISCISKPGFEALKPFEKGLTKLYDKISNFNSAQSGVTSFVGSKISEATKKAKTSAGSYINKTAMQAVRKSLDNKLMKLKPKKGQEGEHTNLAEAIASIVDPEFHAKLNRFSKPDLKIRYLLSKAQFHECLKPFIEPLEEYKKKVSQYNDSNGSIASYVAIKAKAFGTKILDKAKEKGADIIKTISAAKSMTMFLKSKAKIDGKDYTFAEALSMYCKENPSAVKEIQEMKAIFAENNKNEKSTITAALKNIQEMEKLINSDNDSAKKWLAPFRDSLNECREKIKNGNNLNGSNLKDAAISKLKSIGTKFLDTLKKKIFGDDSDPKKVLPKDLYNVKSIDGSSVLGDEIIQIAKDNGFLPLLTHIPTGIGKAKYLQQLNVPGLEKYKTGLGEYISSAGSNLKNKLGNIGKNLKGALGGVFGGIKGFFGKKGEEKNLSNGTSENSEETEEGIDPKTKKKSLFGILKDKILKKDKEDSVSGNSASEMIQAKVNAQKERREEQRDKNMERMANALENMENKGIALDDETKKHLDESNEKAAFTSETKNGQGVLSTIQGFLDKTGLKNTRVGQALGRASGKVKDLLGSAGKLIPSGVGGKVGGLLKGFGGALTKIPGIGGLLGGAGAAAGGMLGAAGSALGAAAGGVASAALGAAKGLAGKAAKGGIGIIKKILEKFVGIRPIKNMLGTAANTLKQTLVNAISKFAPKLGAKLAAASTPVIGWIAWGVSIAAGFTKGLVKVKDYFKLGTGIKPNIGMKLCSGLANCLDAALFGIPSIVCKLLGKPNVAVWLYDHVGTAAAKAAMERYRKYNQQRAAVFGVNDPDALINFENRAAGETFGEKAKTAIVRFGRWLGNKITFGAMETNDAHDARILGFKYVEIFKYWKEEKFKPLYQLRSDIAKEMGVKLKEMDEMVLYDPNDADEDGDGKADDEDGDGKIDNEDSKAAKAQAQIEQQQAFRVSYLEAARKWVLEHKLAWLTCRCTPEMFAKFTGKNAGKELSDKGALGRMGDTIKDAIVNSPGAKLVKGVANFIKDPKAATQAAIGKMGELVTTANTFMKAGAVKGSEWMSRIFSKYKITDSNNATKVMNEASDAIHKVNESVDPGFYMEQKGANMYGMPAEAQRANMMVHANSSGGSEGGKGGQMIMLRKDGKVVKSEEKGAVDSDVLEKTPQSSPKPLELNKGTGKGKAKQTTSAIEELTDSYNTKIVEYLGLLKEIHEENLRYHGVAENFFTAALQMMSAIAASSGKSGMSDRLNSMINEIVH